MFDFFRDIAHEIGGIDVKSAAKEREEKKERKKLERFIFTKKLKVIVLIIGGLYLLYAASMISAVSLTEGSAMHIAKYTILILVDIATCASLLFGKRTGEIIALIGSILFITLSYVLLFITI